MLFYALRGKYGAIVITIYMLLMLPMLLKENFKINVINILYGSYLIIFAVILHTIRSISFEPYLVIGYLAASLLLFNSNIKLYENLWKCLQIISLLEALGIYLQKFLPQVYYLIMSVILPSSVVTSIKKRLLEGYYTGFTREVSYTMFLIAIGLGIYIFNVETQEKFSKTIFRRKLAAILFLFGALFLSGKRATILFSVMAIFIIQFLKSNDKLKILKYLAIGVMAILIIILTFPLWSKIPALKRMVELLGFIGQGDVSGLTNGRISIYRDAITLWNSERIAGIGWGNFKYSTQKTVWYAGFDVHNCYLQILCETGIIGALLFYILTLTSIFNFIRCINRTQKRDVNFYKLALLTGYIQLFFMMYSVTEPILYEYTDYIIYFICINITGIILKNTKEKRYKI